MHASVRAALLLPTVSALHASTLWSRSQALSLANHPLFIQLGTGELPYGSLIRLGRDRGVILDGARTAVATACAELIESHPAPAATLLELMEAEANTDASAFLAAAADAGRTIDVPGVECYSCGGPHLNVDCPEDTAPSSAAVCLAAHLRGASGSLEQLGAASNLFRTVGWVHATLRAAGLSGGGAYDAWVSAHAERWPKLALACEELFEVASGGAAEDAGAAGGEEAAAASAAEGSGSMLFAWIDSEAAVAGLKGGDGSSLQRGREAIEAVESGFLAGQDKNAAFLRETLGATSAPSAAGAGAAPAGGGAAARAEKLKAAAAYLASKRAAAEAKPSVLADAKAANLASKKGPKQAAAQKYLELRKKQQAAAA